LSTPPGGSVTVAAVGSGDQYIVGVTDTGIGIGDGDRDRVFERFYRGEKTRAREEGGSGLGLSIVQGLARANSGEVAIESIEGHGTTVTVWFPAAHAAVDPPPPPPPPSLRG